MTFYEFCGRYKLYGWLLPLRISLKAYDSRTGKWVAIFFLTNEMMKSIKHCIWREGASCYQIFSLDNVNMPYILVVDWNDYNNIREQLDKRHFYLDESHNRFLTIFRSCCQEMMMWQWYLGPDDRATYYTPIIEKWWLYKLKEGDSFWESISTCRLHTGNPLLVRTLKRKRKMMLSTCRLHTGNPLLVAPLFFTLAPSLRQLIANLIKPFFKTLDGKITYQLPKRMKTAELFCVSVRVAHDDLPVNNFAPQAEGFITPKSVKITPSMRCTVFESGYEGSPHFEIQALNQQDQEIERSSHTQWLFSILPLTEGNYKLVIKVSKIREGEVIKDVLTEVKDVTVKKGQAVASIRWTQALQKHLETLSRLDMPKCAEYMYRLSKAYSHKMTKKLQDDIVLFSAQVSDQETLRPELMDECTQLVTVLKQNLNQNT